MAVALTQTTLVPELQHWMNQFIINQKVNKFGEPPPVDIPELYLGRTSFIELLFNDSYSRTTYDWKYKLETDVNKVPRVAVRRLQVYPGSWQYLVIDSTAGDNVFNLQDDDFTMLNALLAYRLDSTSVTIVDSTAITTFDQTTKVLTGSFDSLRTELSKLIWLYLELKIRNNVNLYNSENPISTGGFVETCYEQYVVDQYFKFLSARLPDLIDGGECS